MGRVSSVTPEYRHGVKCKSENLRTNNENTQSVCILVYLCHCFGSWRHCKRNAADDDFSNQERSGCGLLWKRSGKLVQLFK